ncbi:hypothetical protein MKJ01_01845 [Chryseobacterium sp. SSA4.19]|nr:hypothetical protein [Chryseobacterium sp. SSA4.19]MCJ8152500.1 hypothetical protein [Chryseobacterium sp. SSA4.19]
MLKRSSAIGMEAVILFLDSDVRKNLKKDMSGQPGPCSCISQGRGRPKHL